MNFDEYMKMKNFSQENFALPAFAKTALGPFRKFKLKKELIAKSDLASKRAATATKELEAEKARFKSASNIASNLKEGDVAPKFATPESLAASKDKISKLNSVVNKNRSKELTNLKRAIDLNKRSPKLTEMYIARSGFKSAYSFSNQVNFGVGSKIINFLKDPSGLKRRSTKNFVEGLKSAGAELVNPFIKETAPYRFEGRHIYRHLKNDVLTKGPRAAFDEARSKAEPLINDFISKIKSTNRDEVIAKARGQLPDAINKAKPAFKKAVAQRLAAPVVNTPIQGGMALGAAAGAYKAGKAIWGSKNLKGLDGAFQKVGSVFTSGRDSLLTTGAKRAQNQASLGKKIVAGTGLGLAGTAGTAYALASSGKLNPGKYYIFDQESGQLLGSSNGYASKAEALNVRNSNFPGARINLGNTLAQKV